MKVLYKIKSGSHLYGLTTPFSDVDYVGVYVEDHFEDLLNPFNNVDEVDMSFKSKLANGKNADDAIDEKYYHLKKFLRLCADCNPNIVEMLFAPKECVEYVDPFFQQYILDHPEIFINVKLIDRFIGYAKSQEQKSYTKSENYINLEEFKKRINGIKSHILLRDLAPSFWDVGGIGKTYEKQHTVTNIETILVVGDMEFPMGITVKQAIERIEDRFKRASHRTEGILINKYEPKFMSHTIRLLAEGRDLLLHGRIEFPFKGPEKDLIMAIKTGVIPVQDIPNIVNEYKNTLSQFEEAEKELKSIPQKANFEMIKQSYHALMMELYDFDYWSNINCMD